MLGKKPIFTRIAINIRNRNYQKGINGMLDLVSQILIEITSLHFIQKHTWTFSNLCVYVKSIIIKVLVWMINGH